MHRPRGFTLIELLIVVAIIAILAAIAIPNFLEAQVRSKVARAKADQRSLGTAVESYVVDWRVPPWSTRDMNNDGGSHYLMPAGLGFPFDRWNWNAVLTTPLAYMNSMVVDPFSLSKTIPNALYDYDHFTLLDTVDPYYYGMNSFRMDGLANGYTWLIVSNGPSHQGGFDMHGLLQGATHVPNSSHLGYTWQFDVDQIYDPSNGTISHGIVARSNKGILDQTSLPGPF